MKLCTSLGLGICLAGALVAQSAFAQDENESLTGSQQPSESSAPPVNFRKEDNFITVLQKRLSEFKRNPKIRKKRYKLASGSTEAPANVFTDTGIDEFYVAFKEAYALAAVNMIMQDTRVKAAADLKSTTANSKGANPSEKDRCVKEFEQSESEQQRKQEEYDRSLAKGVRDGLFAIAGKEDPTSQPSEDPESLNKLITCQAKFAAKELKLTLKKNTSGSIYGLRVMTTMVKDGRIGVIVGRSRESATSAGQLAAQNAAPKGKALADVDLEIEDAVYALVDKYMASNFEPPFGVIGLRGVELSNGEMAYVGFGSGLQTDAVDEMDDIANSMEMEAAGAKAIAAFIEFAYMTASSDFSYEVDKAIERVIDEVIDMAQRGETVDIKDRLQKTLTATMKRNLSTSARGFLSNPTPIFTEAYSGGEDYPDFYLSAVAWSPSLMRYQMDLYGEAQSGYEEGKTPVNNRKAPQKRGEGDVKEYTLDEDW